MNKQEVALELTKLISHEVISTLSISGTYIKPEVAITEAYNYIFENLSDTEK